MWTGLQIPHAFVISVDPQKYKKTTRQNPESAFIIINALLLSYADKNLTV